MSESDRKVVEYLSALRQRAEAKKKLEEMHVIITRAGEAVADALKQIPDQPGAREVAYSMTQTPVEFTTLPTAGALIDAWRELLTATGNVQSAWAEIPHDARLGLLPPSSAT